jgi:hypothetical protein
MIQPCSAVTGENLVEGLDWTVKDVASRSVAPVGRSLQSVWASLITTMCCISQAVLWRDGASCAELIAHSLVACRLGLGARRRMRDPVAAPIVAPGLQQP